MMKLENKLAVVTGGAMGNGLGIVKVFLKYGAKVIILDYADILSNTIIDLRKEFPNNVVSGYKVDIRDNKMVNACISDIIQKYGDINILVNNAGVCRLETFENMDDELRNFHFDINIKGTWNVTKAVLPSMKKTTAGSIVNLSSVTGPMVADSGEVAYATTKAALIGFTKGLAAELVTSGIRVNAIMPGYIHTPMVDGMAKVSNPEHPEEVVKGIAMGIPMKRLGTIEELGELAAFLASEESSYITAQGIVIDGGSTLPETMVMGV
ncbi:MAG: SDR family oxidoreductase UcpA [Firmicutes bacterium]|nr:SDR family oxidoreductase UcpA [Bacillota bacterium]